MAEDRMSKEGKNTVSSGFQPWTSQKPCASKGLKVGRHFSNPDKHPFDEIEWDRRQARITDETGRVIFEQKDVEVPVSWSQLAAKVVVSKNGVEKVSFLQTFINRQAQPEPLNHEDDLFEEIRRVIVQTA